MSASIKMCQLRNEGRDLRRRVVVRRTGEMCEMSGVRWCVKWFCENISYVAVSADIVHCNNAILDETVKVVMAKIDVLSFGVDTLFLGKF